MVNDPMRVRVTGPLAAYAEGFAGELALSGYTAQSVTRHLRLMAQVSRWLTAGGLDGSALTAAGMDAFLGWRRDAGYRRVLNVRTLEPLLGYLRQAGVAPQAAAERLPPAEVVLRRYRAWLTGVRGVSAGCARNRENVIRPFLAGRAARAGGRLCLEQLTAAEVHEFLLAEAGRRRGSGPQCVVSALRSFLRFLHAEGVIGQPLAQAVPSVAGWSLAGLPKALDADQVQALLGSCDTGTPAGRRDLAILSLLARLGLRRGEVASLMLDDIDWRAGEITIRGKGNRRDRLPLPADIGEVLAGYLASGRPRTACDRAVFVRIKAPHRRLTGAGVANVVRRAAERAGLRIPVNAHCLRHSAATGMLRAGASLAAVGQVLRHARPLTTAIYAKVDQRALPELARPWPGASA